MKKEFNDRSGRVAGSGILRNSMFILLARMMQIGSSFLVFIAVGRYLTVAQYSDYAFIVAYVSAAMTISYFGIQQALIKNIAKDRAQAPMLVGAAIRLRLLLSAAAASFLVISFALMEVTSTTFSAALVAIISEALLTFSMLSKAVFQGFEKMLYEPLLALVSSVVLLLCASLVIGLDMGMLWLFVATAMANATQLFVSGRIMVNKFVQPTLKVPTRIYITMFQESFLIGIGVICYLNLFKINVLMLRWFGNAQEIAFFQVPHNMVLQLQVIPLALIAAIFPVVSRLVERDINEVRVIFERTFRYVTILSVFIAVFIFSFSKEILILLFDTKYGSSIHTLRVVAWAIIPLSLDMLCNSMLLAMNKQKPVLIYAVTTLAASAMIAYVFLPSHGYIAGAYISLCSYTLLLLLSFTLVWQCNIRIPLLRTLTSTLAAILICGTIGIYVKSLSLFLAMFLCIFLYFSIHIFFRTMVFSEFLSLRGKTCVR